MTHTTLQQQGKRVAVIGSGLAGLSTAYLLKKRGITVYLIEKASQIIGHFSNTLGFHSSSIEIKDEDDSGEKTGRDTKADGGKRWTVDVPMRSFQGGYYPNLIALYRHLGIPLVATHYTFSFTRLLPFPKSTSEPTLDGRPRIPLPHFIHSGASGRSIPSLPSSAYRSPIALIPSAFTLIAYAGSYLLLLALAFLSYHDLLPCLFSGTLSDFTNQISTFLYHPIPLIPLYTPLGMNWRSFIRDIVIPLFSSVGTMPEDEVYKTPVKVLLEYVHKTVGTDHYTPAPGHSARTIAERLAESVREQGEGYVKLGNAVKGLRYERGEVVVQLGEEEVRVDRVVLATPASAAGHLLGMLEHSIEQAGEGEVERLRSMKSALKGVSYKETIVITHRDSSILPHQADIRDINLIHPHYSGSSTPGSKSRSASRSKEDGTPHFEPGEGYTMATHVIRPPSVSGASHRGGAVYQTTNPLMPIDQHLVLGTALLERALPLPNPSRTIPQLHPSPGLVYLAGAYAYPGIPLLEGCIGSSRRVVCSLVRDFELDVHTGTGKGSDGDAKGDRVDWRKGRGGVVGRIWRWRKNRDEFGI